MYQVLARKWRPQTFDDLVGQDAVARTLGNAIDADRVAHAYVFSGLRGTGKTSVARILAKCLNCESGPTPAPCNTCTACREITDGRAVDVLEVDAASRTQVDKTRELLETLSYAPVRDRFKILIIDEVHMLSRHSFNALLKTLEEPPPRVVFVLATTELHKILTTILSRCQVFEFRRVPPGELAAHLRKVCDAEQVEISDASLERIARSGEGSVRDALSLLERVLAFAGQNVADDDVLTALGAVRTEVLVRLARGLASRDAAEMLSVLDEVADEGRDLLHVWQEWLGVLRDLIVVRAAPDREGLLLRSAQETRQLIEAAEGLSREDLTRAFQVLAELEYPLKTSSQPRFLFDAAVVRLCSLGAVRPIEEFLERLGGGTGELPEGGPASGSGSGGGRAPSRDARPRRATETRGASDRAGASARAAGPADNEPPHPADGPEATPRPAPPAGPPLEPTESVPTAAGADPAPTAIAGNGAATGGARARFAAEVAQAKPLLGGLLDHADIGLAGSVLTIAFPSTDAATRKQVQRDDYREVLLTCARTTCGADVTVRVVEGAATPATPATRTARGTAHGADRRRAGRELLETARTDPGVDRLLREFGASVIDIRPLGATPSPAAPDGAVGTEESP